MGSFKQQIDITPPLLETAKKSNSRKDPPAPLVDNQLTFENQITAVKNKCFNTIRNIRNIRYLLSDDYGNGDYGNDDYENGIYFGINERLQNAAAKAITKKYELDHMDVWMVT